jgi:hypothetical protein
MVFQKENRHPADKVVVARAIGYGGINGKSLGMISALTKYGLLEPVGEQLRLTRLGLDLAIHEPGDPERAEAVRRAALLPTLFADLYDQFGDELPSDQNLRSYLVKRGFNPQTVDGVIRAYRDTMAFVENEAGGLAQEPDDAPYYEEPMQAPTAPSVARTSTPTASPTNTSSEPAFDGLELRFNLSEDTDVRSTFRGRVTQEAIRKFIQLLEVSLDTFPRRDAPAPAPTEPSESPSAPPWEPAPAR